MTVQIAHRILIGCAVLFFAFYGFWEYSGARGTGGGPGGIARGTVSMVAAAVLGAYFATLWRRGGSR